MMAKVPFTATITGSGAFDEVSGDIRAKNLSGPEKSLREAIQTAL